MDSTTGRSRVCTLWRNGVSYLVSPLTSHFSDSPLFRRPIVPTAHYSDDPLFRQTIIPTKYITYLPQFIKFHTENSRTTETTVLQPILFSQ